MPNDSFKKTCQKLRREGLTLGEICSITGRPKTSAYFHIKNIPINGALRSKIVAGATRRIVKFNRSRKGKSSLGRHPKEFGGWTPALVRLIGHLIFDGEITNNSCVYTNSNIVLISRVEGLMRLVYDFEPRKAESTPGVYRISFHNVELAPHLKRKAEELVDNISVQPTGLQKEFLKSFFDDEGSVYFIRNKRLVRGYQHSLKILLLIKELLMNFGIESRIDSKHQEIVISKKENIIRFRDKINFSKGVYINPNRSNSIWRKKLEKREILDKAIASYKL